MRIPPAAMKKSRTLILESARSVSSSGRAIWTAKLGWYGNVITRTWLLATFAFARNVSASPRATRKTCSSTGSVTFCPRRVYVTPSCRTACGKPPKTPGCGGPSAKSNGGPCWIRSMLLRRDASTLE